MGPGRILVVDDDPDARSSVRAVLVKDGYDVVEAEDGEKGIEAIRAGDNPLLVDTIICDVRMPKINGIEAIVYFRGQFPTVPVVVMTGYPDLESATDLMKLGVFDYLVKPVDPNKLLDVVKKATEEHVLFKDQIRT